MNKEFYLDTLNPADRLVIPKGGLNLIQHHAIYLGKDDFGNRLYLENAIGRGVQIVNEDYLFRDGYQLTRVERFNGDQYQRNVAVQLAINLIGKKYDLLNFNCEHYANTIQHNSGFSKQVGTGVFVGVLALLFAVGMSN